jgi:hypothetical protein
MVKARLIGAVCAASVSVTASGAVPLDDDARFRVTVLQSTARRPDASDVARVLSKADELLNQKTGQRFVQIALVDVGRGDPLDKVQEYIAAHPDRVPDGFLVLSDDRESVRSGGYSFMVPRPDGDRTRFPNSHGAGFAYVAVVDFFHPSPRRAADGPNANQDYARACTIVHEFAHSFGEAGDDDHYRGEACRERMKFSPEQATERAAQEQCGMCPDVFAKFKRVPGDAR